MNRSKGAVVGLVGVDMDSSRVIQRQQFIGNTTYVVIGIAILIAGRLIALFSRTSIRKDEIGELADSFGRMVASLKIMTMDADAGEK